MSTDKQPALLPAAHLTTFTRYSSFQVNGSYLSVYPDTFGYVYSLGRKGRQSLQMDLKILIVTHVGNSMTFQIDVVAPAPGSPTYKLFLARITALIKYIVSRGVDPDEAMQFIKEIRSYYLSLNN